MQVMLRVLKKIDKRFLLIIPVILIGLAIFGYIKLSNRLTKLEEVKIREISDMVIPYIGEVIDHGEEDGNYVSFALDYLNNVENKETFTLDELIEIINKFFNKNYTKEEASKLGLTSYLMNRGILYDSSIDGYTYKYNKTMADIAEIPIVKYEIKKIKKINDEKFTVTYDKYSIQNPYSLLNYYNEQQPLDEKAVNDIKKYLKTESSIASILKYATKDIMEKIGKKEKEIKIEYVVVDSGIKISTIG